MNRFLASPKVLKLPPMREHGQEMRRTSSLLPSLNYHSQEQHKKEQQVSSGREQLEIVWVSTVQKAACAWNSNFLAIGKSFLVRFACMHQSQSRFHNFFTDN